MRLCCLLSVVSSGGASSTGASDDTKQLRTNRRKTRHAKARVVMKNLRNVLCFFFVKFVDIFRSDREDWEQCSGQRQSSNGCCPINTRSSLPVSPETRLRRRPKSSRCDVTLSSFLRFSTFLLYCLIFLFSQIFGKKKCLFSSEVQFVTHYQSALQKVRAHDTKSAKHDGSMTSSLLASIASSAARGVSSLSLTSVVDRLLELPLQSLLVDVNERDDDITSSTQSLVPSLVALDIACAGAITLKSTLTLLDAAISRLPSHLRNAFEAVSTSNASSPSLELPVSSILSFLASASDFARQASVVESDDVTSKRSTGRLGLNSVLASGDWPLSADEFQKIFEYRTKLTSLMEEVLLRLVECLKTCLNESF